jgi:ATP-dependent DNA ligase
MTEQLTVEASASERRAGDEQTSGAAAAPKSGQLSLRLDTDLPNLPDLLRPMLARPLPEPFDSDDHFFEPSWGGLRALAFIGPAAVPGAGGVRLLDADGRDVGAALTELAGLAVRVDARSAVLDGELVVVDRAGRADPRELQRRIAGKAGRPVAYLAFDLLHLDGRSLLSRPLARRRDELRRVLRPGDEVVAVPAIPSEGRALFDAVVAQGIAGVMARQRSSPYLSGVRSRLWRFIPASASATESVAPQGDATAAAEAEGPASAPVIALIRRLPLLDEEE